MGWLIKLWLIHILSEQSHCLNLVRDWVKSVPETLARLTGQPISELDCTDDRLADGLRYLSVDADWRRIEQQVGQRLIRVYDLPTARVRLDSTTATVGHDPDQHTLFQVGKTKAGTYDTQFKLMLASLDPLGLPLAADVVAGNCADDPLYVPCYRRIKATLARDGLLLVGDSKMSALETRAAIVAGRDYYLLPYPYAKDAPDWLPELLQPVWDKHQALRPVFLPEDLPTDASALDPKLALAEGFEVTRADGQGCRPAPHLGGALPGGPLARLCRDRRRGLAPAPDAGGSGPPAVDPAPRAWPAPDPGRGRVAGPGDRPPGPLPGGGVAGRHLGAGGDRAPQAGLSRAAGAHGRRRAVRHHRRQASPGGHRAGRAVAGLADLPDPGAGSELTLAEAVLAYREEYIVENIFRRLKGRRCPSSRSTCTGTTTPWGWSGC